MYVYVCPIKTRYLFSSRGTASVVTTERDFFPQSRQLCASPFLMLLHQVSAQIRLTRCICRAFRTSTFRLDLLWKKKSSVDNGASKSVNPCHLCYFRVRYLLGEISFSIKKKKEKLSIAWPVNITWELKQLSGAVYPCQMSFDFFFVWYSKHGSQVRHIILLVQSFPIHKVDPRVNPRTSFDLSYLRTSWSCLYLIGNCLMLEL